MHHLPSWHYGRVVGVMYRLRPELYLEISMLDGDPGPRGWVGALGHPAQIPMVGPSGFQAPYAYLPLGGSTIPASPSHECVPFPPKCPIAGPWRGGEMTSREQGSLCLSSLVIVPEDDFWKFVSLKVTYFPHHWLTSAINWRKRCKEVGGSQFISNRKVLY